jgi:hypothetical protein
LPERRSDLQALCIVAQRVKFRDAVNVNERVGQHLPKIQERHEALSTGQDFHAPVTFGEQRQRL